MKSTLDVEMDKSKANPTVSQEIMGEVGATIAIVAIFGLIRGLTTGIRKLRSKTPENGAGPKLKADIKKIESETNRLNEVSEKLSKRGLKEKQTLKVSNSFVVGKNPREFLKHLDSEYARFNSLYKSTEGPLKKLYTLDSKVDEDGAEEVEDEMDRLSDQIIKLKDKQWKDNDLDLTRKLKANSGTYEIESPDAKEAEAILKIGTYLVKLKTDYADLPYSGYAHDACSWVWEVQQHLDGLISGVLSYITEATK